MRDLTGGGAKRIMTRPTEAKYRRGDCARGRTHILYLYAVLTRKGKQRMWCSCTCVYLKTAECRGPRRIRSLSAASCRDRDAAGAELRAFSSRRKEMSRGNKMATS